MENGFKVHVSGITKNEYMAAARWLSLNKIVPIAILAVAAAICLVVFGSGDPALLLFPVVAIGFALVYYEMINLRDYKKFPADLQMDYEIDSRGWRLYVMDTTGLCAWGALVLLSPLLPGGKLGELLCLGLCALLGVGVYALLTLALGLQEARLGLDLVKRIAKRG